MSRILGDSASLSQAPLLRNQNPYPSISSYYSTVVNNVKVKAEKTKSTDIQAFFNLFSAFVGIGVLSLPKGLSTPGLGLGVIGFIILAILCYVVLYLNLKIADDQPGAEGISLRQLAGQHLGRWAGISVEVAIFFMQAGICIGILLFTDEFLTYAFCAFEQETLCSTHLYNLLICIVLVVPLSFVNNLHFFYIPSLIATVLYLIGIGTQTYYNFTLLHSREDPWSDLKTNLKEFDPTQLPLFFGVAIFGFEGIGVLFGLRKSMEAPRRMKSLLGFNMLTCTILYIFFSIVSVIALPKGEIPEIVLLSLPKETFYLVVQTAYAIGVAMAYPLQLAPSVRIVEQHPYFQKKLFDPDGRIKNRFLRYAIRIVLQIIIFTAAFTLQSFFLFLNLIGSCFFTYLAFILPVMLYQKVHGKKTHILRTIFHWLIALTALVLGLLGAIESVKAMIDYENE